MGYYGGINFDYWIGRVMTAPGAELPTIRAEFEDLLRRQAETEAELKRQKEMDKPTKQIRNELKVHPYVVIQGNY